jgi:hypothetical protein
MRQRLIVGTRDLAAIDTELRDLRAVLGSAATTEQADQEGGQDGQQVPSDSTAKSAETSGEAAEGARTAGLARLQQLRASRSQLAREWAALNESVKSLERLIVENEGLHRELLLSQAELTNIQQSYESDKKRFGGAPLAQGPSILTAPERIKVIDPPTDPTLPVGRRMYVVLAGSTAGLVLALFLAIMAEVFDPTIRYPEQLVRISGVPIVSRIPKMS